MSFRKAWYVFQMVIVFAIPCIVFADNAMVYKNLGTTASTFGYIEYLPPGYDSTTAKRYPLIVALHGVGSGGDGVYGATSSGHLQSAAIGPMLIIKNDLAAGRMPYFGTNEVVVITPQGHSNVWFDPWEVNGFLTYLESAYRLDASRLYLTGLSMGGGRTWDYVRDYGGRLAAVMPICGASWNPVNADHFIGVSVWAFHNWDDATVSRTLTIDWARAITGALADYTADPLALYPHLSNNVSLPAAGTMTGLFSSDSPGWTWEQNVVTNGDCPLRVTLYPSGGHGAWTKVYSNYSVWDWLLNQSLTPKVTGAPQAFTTNSPFTIMLHVDRNYAYWSTNGSAYSQCTTNGVRIRIDRSTVLRYYGKDTLHMSGVTNSIVYTIDTNMSFITPPAVPTNLTPQDRKLSGAVILNNPCRRDGDAVIASVPESVVATVYSVSGKRIAVVIPTDADRLAGRITWDLTATNGRKVVPGVYLCHLTSNSETIIVKIMVQP